jgi:hypothetical protein
MKYYFSGKVYTLQYLLSYLLEASNMSGIVARNLSGLIWSPMEVPDETDGDVTGDPEDAI